MRTMTRFVLALSVVASCAHPSDPGVRNGAITDGADPALARLSLSVHARQVWNRPLELWIYLELPGATRDACFAADTDYRVTVDGQPATISSPGGKASPMRASGVEWQITECEPAAFLWRAEAGFAPSAASLIVIEHAGRHANATISHLTTPRVLRVSSERVRPGDRVTIEWSPRDDEWPRRLGASVRLYAPNESLAPAGVGHARRVDSTWVNFGGALEGRASGTAPRFHFTMPNVRPGPVHLGLSFNPYVHSDARPKIVSCTGITRCAATVHNGPGDVVITVL